MSCGLSEQYLSRLRRGSMVACVGGDVSVVVGERVLRTPGCIALGVPRDLGCITGVGSAFCLAALYARGLPQLCSFGLCRLGDVPRVGVEDLHQVVLWHGLREAVTGHDRGVNPATLVGSLVIRGEFLQETAVWQVVEPSAPKKLAKARELNTQPLVDSPSDWLVKAVCAALAVRQPLRLAPGRC